MLPSRLFYRTLGLMVNIFQYNSVEYWEKSNRKWFWLFRAIAGIYVIAGFLYFFDGWNGEKNTWNLSLALLYIIGGGYWFIFPKGFSRANSIGVQFVTVDHERIKWSSGIFRKPNELLLADISSYKIFIGEVHFTTTQGEIVKLPIHMIEDEEKHDEFLNLLQAEVFHNSASPV